MKKVFKFLGVLVCAVVLVVVLAVVLLTTLASPNRLKPLLIDQVKKYTGRELTVDGNLSWTFFPYLGVKIGHVALSSSADFPNKTFAEVGSATLGVKFMPLFSGKVESTGIVLQGMKLHLIKNAKGNVNWSFSKNIPISSSPVSTESSASLKSKRAILGLAISAVDVSNASITYLDEQTKKSYDIKQFELHAKNINLMQPFPIKSSFDFTANNPAASGHITLTGNTALNLSANIYTLRDVNFTANLLQGGKKINMSVTGDVMTDLNQGTLVWTGFKGTVANVLMTGKINVSRLTTSPVATGHLLLQPFDLKETLKNIGQNVDNIQIAKTVKGDMDFTAGANIVNMQGNLTIDTFQAAKIKMTNINVKAHFQDGVLNLAPITASFYQGSLNGQAKINVQSVMPQMTLYAKLANVQAEPLMDDLGSAKQKIKIAGLGNIELQVTTSGAESAAIVSNLNGTSQFSFNNGTIVGIDLGYLIDSAAAFAKQQAVTATNNDKTNFGTLTGTATIKNGVITNNDLFADAPRFATRGTGTINLVSQKIDYTLQTTVKQRTSDQKDDVANLYGVALPVIIKGNLENPSIRLDSSALAKAVAEQQMKRVTTKATEKVVDQLKEKFPDKANQLLKGKAGDVLNNLLGN
jgi:AsmA protein